MSQYARDKADSAEDWAREEVASLVRKLVSDISVRIQCRHWKEAEHLAAILGSLLVRASRGREVKP